MHCGGSLMRTQMRWRWGNWAQLDAWCLMPKHCVHPRSNQLWMGRAVGKRLNLYQPSSPPGSKGKRHVCLAWSSPGPWNARILHMTMLQRCWRPMFLCILNPIGSLRGPVRCLVSVLARNSSWTMSTQSRTWRTRTSARSAMSCSFTKLWQGILWPVTWCKLVLSVPWKNGIDTCWIRCKWTHHWGSASRQWSKCWGLIVLPGSRWPRKSRAWNSRVMDLCRWTKPWMICRPTLPSCFIFCHSLWTRESPRPRNQSWKPLMTQHRSPFISAKRPKRRSPARARAKERPRPTTKGECQLSWSAFTSRTRLARECATTTTLKRAVTWHQRDKTAGKACTVACAALDRTQHISATLRRLDKLRWRVVSVNPTTPWQKSAGLAHNCMAKGSSEVLMIPNNFPVCLPAECKGFPLPVCTLWKFSQVQQASLQKWGALDASAAQASVRMSQSRPRHLLNVLTFQTRQGKHFCGGFWKIHVYLLRTWVHMWDIFQGQGDPLRSDKFPDGLANLPPRDQARVDTANKLYKFSGEILACCTKHGIICSLENPARSHMWNMPFLKSPLQGLSSQLQEVLFHHCMLGSKRRKRTKLLVNHCCFSHFRRECENAHEHDAWGTRPQGGQLLMKWSTHMGYVESGLPVWERMEH